MLPKNILMIGPTGVGKTEISRRLAKLASAPFLKVEATKFTEVGYVGRDVEQIVRDLVEIGIGWCASKSARTSRRAPSSRPRSACSTRWSAPAQARRRARASASGCATASSTTRKSRSRCKPSGGMPMFEIPGMPGAQIGAISIGDMLGKAFGGRTKTRRVNVKDSHPTPDRRGGRQAARQEQVVQEAIRAVENNGIVFLDEIDKICAREGRSAPTCRAKACSAICCR